MNDLHTVTGAFGFTGRYITRLLLENGCIVRTLTNSQNNNNAIGDKIEVAPLHFGNYDELVESLKGTLVLYNTYWIRFDYKNKTVQSSHAKAADNTLRLFHAAKEAGVKRIVHISIVNASEDSPFEYFKYKAKVEEALKELGVTYAILRPAFIFGKEDILINNLAWSIRKLPVFAVFGKGNYKMQPVYVGDLAQLMFHAGHEPDNVVMDAAGPEIYTYYELIKMLCKTLAKKRIIIRLPAPIVYYASKLINFFTGDVLLTRDEMNMVRDNLMFSKVPPKGNTLLSEWCRENVASLGIKYASELAKRKGSKN